MARIYRLKLPVSGPYIFWHTCGPPKVWGPCSAEHVRTFLYPALLSITSIPFSAQTTLNVTLTLTPTHYFDYISFCCWRSVYLSTGNICSCPQLLLLLLLLQPFPLILEQHSRNCEHASHDDGNYGNDPPRFHARAWPWRDSRLAHAFFRRRCNTTFDRTLSVIPPIPSRYIGLPENVSHYHHHIHHSSLNRIKARFFINFDYKMSTGI